MKTKHIAFIASTIFCANSAHAQFGLTSLMPGISSLVGKATSNLSNKVFSSDGEDLQAAYDKFTGHLEAQTAGMTPDAKAQHVAMVMRHWELAEQGILLKNEKLQHDKDAPILDMESVSGAALNTVSTAITANIALSGKAGVYGYGGTGLDDSLIAGVKQGALGGVHEAAGKAISGAMGAFDTSTSVVEFTPDEKLNPLDFFNKHPSEVKWPDLYRENGYLGWKRLENDEQAAAYAPISGKGPAKYAVFLNDKETGAIASAFRVLNTSPAVFSSVVMHYAEAFGAPTYTSSGTTLRAVWPNGAFITADTVKLSLGWAKSIQTQAVQSGETN